MFQTTNQALNPNSICFFEPSQVLGYPHGLFGNLWKIGNWKAPNGADTDQWSVERGPIDPQASITLGRLGSSMTSRCPAKCALAQAFSSRRI